MIMTKIIKRTRVGKLPVTWTIAAFSILLAGCAELGINMGGSPLDPIPPAPATNQGSPAELGADQTVDESETAGPFVRPGTGIFINPGAIRQPQVLRDAGGATALNFRNAPIADVASAILGDTLGLAYALDPSIQGTISLQTSGGLSRDALLPVFEQALRLNGLALFRANGIFQIAPIEAVIGDIGFAPSVASSVRTEPGFGVTILPLKFVSASEVAELVRPFVPSSATLQADVERNLILLSGSGQARANILELIGTFDIDWMAGMSLGMFPLENAEASVIVDELTQIVSTELTGTDGGIIRFVPIERLNSVLVITHNASYLDMVEDWLIRLDHGQGEADGRTLHVYRVQNGRAADLADVLGQLFGAEPRSRGRSDIGRADDGLAPGFEVGTIASGDGARSTPVDRSRADNPNIEGFVSSETGLRVIADNANNALVILGSESEHRLIRTALKDLDVQPLQVMIEATIAEVTLNDELRFGIQWFFNSRNSEFTQSNFATGVVAPTFPGFSYVLDNARDIRLVIDALDDVSNVRILSSPQLMVLNNHTAVLQVGDQVPVATRSAQSLQDPDAPIVNTIEFKDTGVILRVTPRVNASGLVLLEIQQEVSSVAQTTTSGIDSPTIQQRMISTTVAVQSNQTLALGGLIQDTVQKSDTGIPFLSRIPVIGNLFKSQRDITTRTELLVLITPRVVRNFEDAQRITEELRERLSKLDESFRK